MTTRVNVGTGTGYSDVSPKQVVRTSGNVAYLIATNCVAYPCTDSAQTVRVYKADQGGIPSTFTRKDSAHEPANTATVGMAIDGSDVLHIVWFDRGAGAIKYAQFSTVTDLWGTAENVDSAVTGTGWTDAGQGDQFCAVALDSNGKAHVAYVKTDGTRRRVNYRNRVSGAWSAATIIDDNTYGANEKAWSPNLAFDTSGRRVFAWESGAFNGDLNGQIHIRVMNTSDVLGTRADVDSGTAKVGIDQSTSLLCNGTIHYTWILGGTGDNGSEFVRYAYATEADSPTFTVNHPANADTHDPSIGPGGSGKIRIYGHGTENPNDDNLYYWEGSGGAGAWSGRILYASGLFDSSVSTRWSQYFLTMPSLLDVVFWDQTYPNNLYYGVDDVTIPAALARSVVPVYIWSRR